jgi:hypothetical protein
MLTEEEGSLCKLTREIKENCKRVTLWRRLELISRKSQLNPGRKIV